MCEVRPAIEYPIDEHRARHDAGVLVLIESYVTSIDGGGPKLKQPG